MRIALFALLVGGCFEPPEEFTGDLDAFAEIFLFIRELPEQPGVFHLSAELYAKGGLRPCPVLADATASVAGVPMSFGDRGGYDDYHLNCDIAVISDDLPAIAGATLEIDAGSTHWSCDLHDVHFPLEVEPADGGTWTRTSDLQSMKFKLVDEAFPPGGVSAKMHPIDDPSRQFWVTVDWVEDDTYSLWLPGLAPNDYVLNVEMGVRTFAEESCILDAKPFIETTITIVAP